MSGSPRGGLHRPLLRDDDVVFADEDVVVVNKPSGLPTHAADPDVPVDLVGEVGRLLASRRTGVPELGVHHRLDAGTSGLLVFSRSRRAARSLSAQFEGRSVEKRYVAAVDRFRAGEGTLVHHLTERTRGRVEVVGEGDPRGRRAELTVEVLARKTPRCLLGITLGTGRTHQVRVQLAALGSPVAGDALYGTTPAPRLLLHASALAFDHPLDGRRLRFEAKVPAIFKHFLDGRADAKLSELDRVVRSIETARVVRGPLLVSTEPAARTDAFRLFHGSVEGAPGLALDVYGDFLVAHLYESLGSDDESALFDRVAGLGCRGLYVKRRPVQANELVDTRVPDLAPSRPVRGDAAPDRFVVSELGLPYEVALGDGLSTGVFLDQRENRRRVRARSEGKRVLNLFAYTGAFSVAALAGGARACISVDAAAPALAWAERNVARIGATERHQALRGDVFALLGGFAARDERFDLVICDPPTYSTTRSRVFRSGADWEELVAAVFRVISPCGEALFCSNDRRMSVATFRKRVAAGLRAAGRDARITSLAPPRDFPVAAGGEPSVKSIWVSPDSTQAASR